MIGTRITMEWEDDMEKRHQEAQQLMDSIDRFLAVGDTAAKYMEAILTGLRGPDDQSHHSQLVKEVTTMPIRRVALPHCADEVRSLSGLLMAFGEKGTPFMRLNDGTYSTQPAKLSDNPAFDHFLMHASAAWEALQWLRQPPDAKEGT